MKTKLTLSIDRAIVRKAKANSKRQGKSVSEIFEEAVERASAAAAPRRKPWSEIWGGSLKLTEGDAAREDRMGRLVRKSRTRATGRAKQRA